MATAKSSNSSKRNGDAAAPAPRRPRADAVRNRQLIVDAATAAFGELGLDASVAEIARRAGVGTGTLFRHFPSKDDLIHAVIETRMQEWTVAAEAALSEPDPGKAFEKFLFAAADAQVRDRGLLDAMTQHVIDAPELLECNRQAVSLSDEILKRAQQAGVVRNDVVTEDLRYLVSAAIASGPRQQSGADDLHIRYLRIMIDGLRPDGASALGAKPPSYAR
jgi:AcrR family transcriptional regulator